MIEEGDDRFKWWRHRGTCNAGLGNMAMAEHCYREAFTRAACPEDRALSAYLICELLVLRGERDEAHDMAARELALHAGFLPEFGWIMAYVQNGRGEKQNASRWCQLVINSPPDRTRVGNRGKNCIKGARALLAHIHAAQPIETINGVDIPISRRFSPKMVQAIRSGSYEATEARLLSGLVVSGDRVLELGAGCGYLATLAAKAGASVVAVEAERAMAQACRNTFEANGVEVTLEHSAVREQSGETALLLRAKDFWSSKLTDVASEATEEVETVSLADLLAEHRPTVLVCDIEGSERHIIGTHLVGVRAVLIETHSDELQEQTDSWLVANWFRLQERSERTALYLRKLYLRKP